MNGRRIPLFLVFTLFAGIAGCGSNERIVEINLRHTETIDEPTTTHEDDAIRIAVGGMITPKQGFMYYKQYLDCIGDKLGRKVKFIDKKSYAVINDMMEAGDIDVAFVCPGPYVDGHQKFGMELLVAPQAYGETVYYSYIIAGKDSTIESLANLRGKKFAFTDPLSNTGLLVPTYMLAQIEHSPKTYFEKYEFTYAHDKSIRAVADGVVDGAAVDSLVWEYMNRTEREVTSRTSVVIRSDPFGIPPVAVRPDLDPSLKVDLKEIFLRAHEDRTGRKILKGMMLDRFVVVDDSHYDSIRDMKRFLAKRNES